LRRKSNQHLTITRSRIGGTGIRNGLKIYNPKGCEGSTPSSCTINKKESQMMFNYEEIPGSKSIRITDKEHGRLIGYFTKTMVDKVPTYLLEVIASYRYYEAEQLEELLDKIEELNDVSRKT